MVRFFDALETREPEVRDREQAAALPGLIKHAKDHAPAYARLLADIDPRAITSREALAGLPVTRKSALISLQAAAPPFGGFATSRGAFSRVLQSPGPIYEPEGKRSDYWRLSRALFAAGFRPGDLVHNCFAYHFTPGGWIFDDGAQALGCPVFPAGTGQTEQQLQAIAALRPTAYVGTPSFLAILLDKADYLGADISSLKKGLVSAEAYLPPQRALFAERGIPTYQCYSTADLGLIAYESPDDSGAVEGMVVDEGVILEVVRPGTGDLVAPGEVGEVLVTTFTPEYPLIRFATGDLSATLPGPSPCGRTNLRIKGWMGRADQTTKVKGMFVHPQQVADVVRRHDSLAKARLIVTRIEGGDVMTLVCETNEALGLADQVAESLRAITKLRGEVRFVTPGSLPNDGKVIEDARDYG
ncbi:AMP-dependent synthetase [Rhodospirillum rubrum]|uniref:phenylacetate--CoA ligase family protein n=1 Tax=Rhodospirillum rubrum TaxID=1085 RepID=UPI001903985A|nr:AMP-binding protein [Rhodospirillum rubrum]MBK1663082.1 AMP-dependent synthetase [Rhodospirillum rubrum]MBK1675763.1 AMP-dependent synthetase [Rhodospirillum rubrum]